MNISTELTLLIYTFFSLSISVLSLWMLADLKKRSLLKSNNKEPADQASETMHFRNNCQKYYLTSREMEILELLSTGKPYKIIASELNISLKTVKSHVLNMFHKTNATNKMELVSRISMK
ncbi:MAG: response regulator transcription factor [Cyclobacteriaceae bacterium]|nr:response regulator transcription factor [Cyclobacteriaceae bacterium]